ncbi:MAG: class I SAM-dependent methyltransferase [Candidatus Izemoplasma sp.]|nr:class I SAM-dependent methyltransferase [Candidatus Izemoplasma sp.]
MNNIIDYAHTLAKKHIQKDSVVVDATCGNGHDTVFLANLTDTLYAFDIQQDAIKNTLNRLNQNAIGHVTLIHDSHINISQHVSQKIDFVMFNLGYLPGGDKSITTKSDSTVQAIKNLFPKLNSKGLIVLVVYVGHTAGEIESHALIHDLKRLSKLEYFVTMHRLINHETAPYVISIKKRF